MKTLVEVDVIEVVVKSVSVEVVKEMAMLVEVDTTSIVVLEVALTVDVTV
jgi:hypothetical protein